MKRLLCISWVFLLFPLLVSAATLDVNCDLPGKAGKISETLRQLDPAGPNVVTIHGTCRENVTINGFDRLTLRAAPGAVMTDASGGEQWAVLLINNSQRIKIRGFHVSGGQVGIVCINGSKCDFANNTMEGQSQNGFSINDSEAIFDGDTVRNAEGPGILINRSKAQINQITSEHNGTGVTINAGTVVGENVNANYNKQAGIFVSSTSHLQLINSTVTNNLQNGIQATSVTTLSLINDTVTNNTFSGVWLSDMTTAFFAGGTYVNNGVPGSVQVECAPFYTVVSNLPGGTSTNCLSH